jgi:hypothetical protein
MLVVFKSKAASEVMMLAEHAKPLLEVAGKDWSERGIFTVDQLPRAISRLEAAMHGEPAPRGYTDRDQEEAGERSAAAVEHVTIGQRAYPLVDMLREAQKMKVDVMWEV